MINIALYRSVLQYYVDKRGLLRTRTHAYAVNELWFCIWMLVIANETKAVVQKEEEEATIKARTTQEIADSAQKDLDEALPALVSSSILMYT